MPPGASPVAPVVEVLGIDKSFAAPVLQSVSAAFHAGEIHAVLGMNGAGKSTLMKIIAGVVAPDGGEIRVQGRPVRFRGPRDAFAAGIAMVYQELDLARHLTVGENLLLGAEPRRRFGRLDAPAERREIAALLDDCGLAVDPRRPLRDLRTGERQQVAIAKAFHRARRLLILDEPTSALNAAEVEALFALLGRLRARGLAIIYISHRFDELERIADRVTVLRNGRVAFTATAEQSYDWPRIALEMVGQAAASEFDRAADAPAVAAPPRLELRAVTLRGQFEDVNLAIRPGEALGLAGIAGDGRAALGECLFGLGRFDCGEVLLDGRPVAPRGPEAAVALGLGFVPDDRAQALCPHLPASANATLAAVPRFASWWRLRRRREAALAGECLAASAVAPPYWPLPARALSGGTQQKLLLARWLAHPCRFLVLNEPTRGVDIRARQEIHAQIDARLRAGLAALIISSDLEELLRLCRRVVVLRRGRVARELAGAALTREAILLAAMPEVAQGAAS
ncbi:MAG TPA: sugar ABC transporter ATP-binding protein [Terriglobales bacterium]|nr:sugar ABC transporter ATP-binding protein [Terriglobales bacterium]